MEVRETSPVVMTAQTIRASLLANATTLGGLRALSAAKSVAQRAFALWRRPQGRDGAQHQKPSDLPTALLGYRPEFLFAAGRVLRGRRAKPSGEIAAGFEGPGAGALASVAEAASAPTPGTLAASRLMRSRRWPATIARASSSIAASRDCDSASRNPSVAWAIARTSAAAACATTHDFSSTGRGDRVRDRFNLVRCGHKYRDGRQQA
jgi:hypothetical protein